LVEQKWSLIIIKPAVRQKEGFVKRIQAGNHMKTKLFNLGRGTLKQTGWLLLTLGVAAIGAAAVIITVSHKPGKVSGLENAKKEKFSTARPCEWAVPIAKDGIPNFFKVSEDLYRGAQPTKEGIVQLRSMGIKTIIDLRSLHSDRDEIGNVEIGYERIYMKTWHPEEEDVIRFLKIVTDKEKTPVFVHCHYGADRTGLMCAIYRATVCGWSKEAAADEMAYGGYGFHPVWKDIVDYFMSLDLEAIKKKAGRSPAGPV
jgi:protein tyrosine phosphatase (PTP) superfamily phosphohydrolase (DUF442 family)